MKNKRISSMSLNVYIVLIFTSMTEQTQMQHITLSRDFCLSCALNASFFFMREIFSETADICIMVKLQQS